MITLNTNLSSLIAQSSLKTSTNKLNEAVERMSTGYKINHAKDNAANYSISTNMSTKLNAYDVAADNVAMGMDLVSTAEDIISNMQNKAHRLQALCTQARNGTYGSQSMQAINSEAAAIMAEINRLYSTAEYNKISLFSNKAYTIDPSLPKAGASGFIDESVLISTTAVGIEEGVSVGTTTEAPKAKYNGFIEEVVEVIPEVIVTDPDELNDALHDYQIVGIANAETLQELANIVNNRIQDFYGTIVLTEDIDLSSIANWTPIGNGTHNFKADFNGNGHVIKNLTIDRPTETYVGLFGYTATSSEIKNVGLEEAHVKGGNFTGSLVGNLDRNSTLNNCYATGSVSGEQYVGGLVGFSVENLTINNSYAMVNTTGTLKYVGGLVGYLDRNSTLNNCYATGIVVGDTSVGGLVGHSSNSVIISNSYTTGIVNGTKYIGGLVGSTTESSIANSYAMGDVTGEGSYIGGLVGYFYSTSSISNSYATGSVSGTSYVGGLVGHGTSSSIITNSYATGSVSGNSNIGGLVGQGMFSSIITNSYATGSVSGNSNIGGLVGSLNGSSISNSYATGDVSGDNNIGGLIGEATANYTDSTCTISDSVTYSKVSGNTGSGSLIGTFTGTNCYGWSYLDGDEGYEEESGELIITNCQALSSNFAPIGGYWKDVEFELEYENPDGDICFDYNYDGTGFVDNYDFSSLFSNISLVSLKPVATNLQVGINGDSSCQISFDTNFSYDLSAIGGDIASDSALACINNFINLLSEKSTMLGAVSNRLESALDSISVNIENLTSSRSTIRDADMAELSSTYIQQQILQQASATLLATANQSPSIALQLI